MKTVIPVGVYSDEMEAATFFTVETRTSASFPKQIDKSLFLVRKKYMRIKINKK